MIVKEVGQAYDNAQTGSQGDAAPANSAGSGYSNPRCSFMRFDMLMFVKVGWFPSGDRCVVS